MCGIAGQFMFGGGVVDGEALHAMREAMHARGPDGAGTWIADDRTVGLAHRRLAILDLTERGAQPMASADGRCRIVFNGEIYNYPALREWCEARGAVFLSGSDTEVLLHMYRLQGPDFIKRLRGMFAFALWDETQQTLLLARDPFGIKPLYYSVDDRRFCFASQVKAIVGSGWLADKEHDPAGIVSFFLWGYVTEPHTLYRGIRALPAGHVARVELGRVTTVRQYCDPLDALRQPQQPSLSGEELREALLDSLRHHLLADVPVGLFLSAGIDSGVLCGLMAEAEPKQRFEAVTLGFREYQGTADDETVLATECARHYECRHAVQWIDREHFVDQRERLLESMDQPTVDGLNTYLVSGAAAASGLKVALSGVGGDEMFGGYPSFRQIPRMVRAGRWVPNVIGGGVRRLTVPLLPRRLSPKLAGVLEYGNGVENAYLLRRALYMPWELGQLLPRELVQEGLEALDPIGSMRRITRDIATPYHQVTALEYGVYLRNCLLRDADWAGMAHSLEIRTPLVDASLFAALGGRSLAGNGAPTKRDLAGSPSRALPSTVLDRPKTGFTVPVREWLLAGSGDASRFPRGLRGWATSLAGSFGIPVDMDGSSRRNLQGTAP